MNIVIKIEGADALLTPMLDALAKLTRAVQDAADALHLIKPASLSPDRDSPEISPPEQPIANIPYFTSIAEIPWPKRKSGRRPSGQKDVAWKWSDERVALMRDMRAELASWGAVHQAVNKLPGVLIESPHACRIKFSLLPRQKNQPVEKPVQAAPARPLAASPALAPNSNKWSDERISLLLKLRAEAYHDKDILAALNMLDGEKLGPFSIRDRIVWEKAVSKKGRIGMRLIDLKNSQTYPQRRAYMFPKPAAAAPSAQKPQAQPAQAELSPPLRKSIIKPPQNIITTPKHYVPPPRPAPGRTVNISTADDLLARDAAAAFDSPIDWQALLTWARLNKVNIEAMSTADAVKKVNAARQALGLNHWRLIPTRANHDNLPHPNVGSYAGGDYSKPGRDAA